MSRKYLFIKILAAALVITTIVGLSAVAYGANTSSDPLVSLSYLTGTYKTSLLSEVNTAITSKQKQLSAEFSQQISDLEASVGTQTPAPAENEFETVTLSAGQSVSVSAGGEVLFLSGTASVDTAVLTDTTAGSSVLAGGALTANHLYISSGDGPILASGSAKLLVK